MIREPLTAEEQERFALAYSRLREIPSETGLAEPYRQFFVQEARFLLRLEDLRQAFDVGWLEDATLEELQNLNQELYAELFPEHYATCPGNPDWTAAAFGSETGPVFSFLYAELRGAIPFTYENRLWDLLVLWELFLEFYTQCATGNPSAKELQETIYYYCFDYSDRFLEDRLQELLDPSLSFAREIILQSDLHDLRYLYRYGEYISDNELRMAAYLNSLPEEEVAAIAKTWTEGYRKGFEVQRKPLDKKETAALYTYIGFERVSRYAIAQLGDLGLQTTVFRAPAHAISKRLQKRDGYFSLEANPQYTYDHRNDAALFLDARSVTRRLQAQQAAYETWKNQAAGHAGPVVLEVFGEEPFRPVSKDSVPQLTKEQQQEQVRYTNEAGQIMTRYINMEERSFTIISYPVPAIGERFEDIFRETVRINNLDYAKYQQIQQVLIDALDQGTSVLVRGCGSNETDLVVRLHPLTNPEKQSNFENCVADVNIPVGEVFTSPVLKGTNGLLHVTSVALEGLRFEDLRIRLQDGMVTDYSCANFDDSEKGRAYIDENILFRHPTLPVGEFAIGTNTTAYQVAQEYDIAGILPILIAEKMGPHFAFGDTCYSWQEEVKVYNPDGKELIARDNECSILRKSDPSKAYFDCHTDITIPYDELGLIQVQKEDGSAIPILENGRFVLPGTEELNGPLIALESRKEA